MGKAHPQGLGIGVVMQRDASDLLALVTLAVFIAAVAIWANIFVNL